MSSSEDGLLYWMSHVGDGTTDRLRRVVESFLGETQESFVNSFLANLTRLGHLSENSNGKWRLRHPTLTALPNGYGVFLRGGRSPGLEGRLAETALDLGCEVQREVFQKAPSRLVVIGPDSILTRLADKIGIQLEEDAAMRAAAALPDLRRAAELWNETPLPTGAELKAFDYDALCWVACHNVRLGSPTALRYIDQYRQRHYYYSVRGRILRAPSKAQAVYAAAPDATLCRFDLEYGRFEARWNLSAELGMPLCLCSGRLPSWPGGREIYQGVTEDVARIVMRRIGQEPAGVSIRWL